MQIENIIAVAVLVLAVGSVLGIRFYKLYKENKNVSFDDFIDLYGDKIVEVLKDSIKLLTIKPENFETKEQYEKAIIKDAVEYIKTNYGELNIDINLLGLVIDNDTLSNIVYQVLHNNYKEAFSILSNDVILHNINLYDTTALYE